MRVIEKADIAPLEPLLCSIKAGTAIIGRSERWIPRDPEGGQERSPHAARRAVVEGLWRVTSASEGDPQSVASRPDALNRRQNA
jgi:hypothetical protein